MQIELKNIDLTKVTRSEQFRKVLEEENEFVEAFFNLDKENMIEEFYDTLQAKLGLMHKCGISAEEVMEGYSKHLVKLSNRPRKKEEE